MFLLFLLFIFISISGPRPLVGQLGLFRALGLRSKLVGQLHSGVLFAKANRSKSYSIHAVPLSVFHVSLSLANSIWKIHVKINITRHP